jgi:hypothetical protein
VIVGAILSLILTAICGWTLAVNLTATCEATFTTPLWRGGRREEGGGKSDIVSVKLD